MVLKPKQLILLTVLKMILLTVTNRLGGALLIKSPRLLPALSRPPTVSSSLSLLPLKRNPHVLWASTLSESEQEEVELPRHRKGKKALPSLYRSEGLFAVDKPLNWTSQNVVSYVRQRLERDAKKRGAKPEPIRRGKARKRTVKVGHGGTLDPLATGVLVIGVGRGTKMLQDFLKGDKSYRAEMELGYETTTLDVEGNVTKKVPFDHVTLEKIESVLPQFMGNIQQKPPIYSAIRKGGKRMYERARAGEEELQVESRTVNIDELRLENTEKFPPKLDIDLTCGGGTYVRSLVRDIAYAVDTVATTTALRRTKQGIFVEADCLSKDDWSADNFFAAIDRFNAKVGTDDVEVDHNT